jgi:hypothetical protein
MQPSNQSQLYKTKIGYTPKFFWIVLLMPIILSVIYYSVNPDGFKVVIVLFSGALLLIPSQEIVVKEHEIEINENRCFNLLKKKTIFEYKDIQKITIINSNWGFFRTTFAPFIPDRNGKELHLKVGENTKVFKNLNLLWRDLNKAYLIIQTKINH